MRSKRNLRWALLATVTACIGPGAASAQPAQDGAVATSIDDVVVAARRREARPQNVPISVHVYGAVAQRDLYDLERGEILKGPQAPRSGRVVGGLINYLTRKPGDEFETRGEVTVGNYAKFDVAASVSSPLSNIFRRAPIE